MQASIASAQANLASYEKVAQQANDELHAASAAADACWDPAEAASAKAAGKDCEALKAAYQIAVNKARAANAILPDARTKAVSLQQAYDARRAKDEANCREIAKIARQAVE
jgi:hypothetical protein